MNIKLKNATVLDAESGKLIENLIVTVKDDLIDKILKNGEPNEKFDREIDFNGDILMPSFINAHAHSAMTLFRGIADDIPLQAWLFDNIFPLEKNLDEECVYNGTMLAIAEYVRGGITTFADMYFMPSAVIAANEKAGAKCVCIGGVSDSNGKTDEEILKEEERFLKYRNYSKNSSYLLGCHAEYTCSEKLLNLLVDLSYKYKTPLYTHASETLTEVGECTVRHGSLTPVQYLHKLGFFDNGAVLAHCVHLDKDDIALISQSNVSIIHNPASNLKLACGISPVYTMLKNNINVALGTDGAASNNNLDMFKEMYLAAVLQKGLMYNAEAVNAHGALKMATLNGAKALRFKNSGVIKAGYKADLLRIDINGIHMRPHNNLLNNLVYAAKSTDVKLTMCNGKILYENGSFNIGDGIDNIIKNAEKSINRLKSKI